MSETAATVRTWAKMQYSDYEFPETTRTVNGQVLTNSEYAVVSAKASWANGRGAPWKSTGILLRELSAALDRLGKMEGALKAHREYLEMRIAQNEQYVAAEKLSGNVVKLAGDKAALAECYGALWEFSDATRGLPLTKETKGDGT